MKRLYIILFVSALSLIAACEKEVTVVETPISENKIAAINAYVNEGDITKTTYSGETTFSWVGNEAISMQVVQRGSSPANRDRSIFYYDVDNSTSTVARFICPPLNMETYALGDYAFYPVNGANSSVPEPAHSFDAGSCLGNKGTGALQITISNYFRSCVAHPLQLVPMIGAKDSEDNFAFHTATGILKVTVTNIDNRLSKVRLFSSGQKLNGTFSLTGDAGQEYYAMAASSSASEYYIDVNYTDWTDETELPFYFPVPVGTLNSGFKIQLLDSGNNVFKEVSAPSAVSIERNKISEITKKISLPAEDFSAVVSPIGTSVAIEADVYIVKDATSVKVVLAANEDAGITLIDNNDASVVTFTANGTSAISMDNINTSGIAYLVYRTYSGSEPKLSGSTPAYVLNSSDASDILSQYMRVLTNVGSWTSYFYSPKYPKDYEMKGDNTITLAASNDPSVGNIMITEFAGYYYDPSLNTHSTMRSDWVGFSKGTPIYANYAHNSGYGYSTGYAEFTDAGNVPFYKDDTSHNHYISEAGSTTLRIATHSTGYSSPATSNDLVVWGATIGNFWDNTNETNSDVCLGRYVGKKTKGMIDLSGKISVSSTGANNNYDGDKWGAAALIDKTDNHWHSDYVDTPTLDPEYGIYAQIDLGESKTIQNFTVNFKTRGSANQLPTKYIIGGSNDNSSWTVITAETAISTAAGKWYQVYANSGTPYRYIRIGFTESAAGDLTSSPSTSKYVALSELQLWEN